MTHPPTDPQQLQAEIHATRLHFLQTELDVGNTMLDTARASHDDDVRARRWGRAREAHDEVARQLAKGDALGLSDAERARIGDDLARLRERLDDGA
ncbi:MAG TPA: hypothetical protein VGD56_05955 [Gemmatirosa sp.]